jgi:tripartite-type tricarboxylate transporter receptor subunit TctC
MKRRLLLTSASVFFMYATWTVSHVGAQTDPFYRGKTLKIVVGTSPGGLYDRWGRLFAQYMGKHIPGNPDVIVQNMPGAGSLVGANYVYNVAKPDGLTLLMPISGIHLDQLIGRKEVKFDVRKFHWVGSQEKTHMTLYMRADSVYKTLADVIKAKEPARCGATGTASSGYLLPKILEDALGAKFHLVVGYPGGAEIDLAVERGEVLCKGLTIGAYVSREPYLSWQKNGFVRLLVQTGRKRDPLLPDTPTIYELMEQYKSRDLNRRVALVVLSTADLGRPMAVTPGTPSDRVKILREAYGKSLKDPVLLSDAKKAKLDVDPSTGDEIQALLNEVIEQPPDVIKRVADLIAE